MSTRVEKLAFLNDRLARRRGFLEAVLQSIQEGVLVVSAEGAVVYANRTAETMLGFESEHARGRPVERFLPDVDWAALARNGGGAWDGVSSLELEVLRPQRRILSVTAFPLAAGDAAAEEPGVVAILRDVTREREDAREALASQNARDMRMWAAQLAHEIGNPLNAISLNLQLMDRSVAGLPEGPDREDLAESLRISRDEVSRLDGLLRNSLNALRGGAPNLVPCDVLAVLRSAPTSRSTASPSTAPRPRTSRRSPATTRSFSRSSSTSSRTPSRRWARAAASPSRSRPTTATSRSPSAPPAPASRRRTSAASSSRSTRRSPAATASGSRS